MLSKDRCCSRTTRSQMKVCVLPFPSLPLHQTQKFVPQLRFTSSKDCSSFRLSAQPNARFVPQPRLLSYSKDRSSSGPSRPLCADLFGSPSKLHACMHAWWEGLVPCSISNSRRGSSGNGSGTAWGTAVGSSVHGMGTSWEPYPWEFHSGARGTEPRGAHPGRGGTFLSCSGEGISAHGRIGSTLRCDIWRGRWGFDFCGDWDIDG